MPLSPEVIKTKNKNERRGIQFQLLTHPFIQMGRAMAELISGKKRSNLGTQGEMGKEGWFEIQKQNQMDAKWRKRMVKVKGLRQRGRSYT